MGKIKINGKEFEFKDGETIYEVAKRNGIFIPTYCYHKNLRIVASCRICIVELKSPKSQILTSCATLCKDGMEILTDSEKVLEERKNIMQLLLLNHPPECPVCDQGGKCLLQDYTYIYGNTFSEFKYEKEYKKYDIGPFLRFYPELCILCERCYRFWKEELNEDEIVCFGRGYKKYVGPLENKEILMGFSNYLIDICPVGAFLDNTLSKFSVREWDLEEVETFCHFCSLFCEIKAYRRKKSRTKAILGGKKSLPYKIYDVKYKNDDGIICDRGKFGKDFILSEKILKKAKIKNKWVEINEEEIISFLKEKIKKYAPESIGILLSARMGNEEIDLLKEFFVNEIGIRNFLLIPGFFDSSFNLMKSDFKIEDVEEKTFILNVGYDFFYSHPVIGFEILRRLRKLKGEILPAHFYEYPFKEKLPFLFSISYQEGKVKREANKFLLTNFKNSFNILKILFSKIYKEYGVKKEIEDDFLNSWEFLRKIENLNKQKEFEEIINRIKKSKKLIVIYQDFIPFEIQKLLYSFKYINFPVKILILRYSPNTEYFLQKKFPLLNIYDFKNKIERGIIKLVIFIYTNPFFDIPYEGFSNLIFDKCETIIFDTFEGKHTEISEFVIPLKSFYEKDDFVMDNFGRIKKIKKVIESNRIDLKEIILKLKGENFEEIYFEEKIEIDLDKDFEEIYIYPSLYKFGYEVKFSESLKKAF
jgi:NADH dehydrogenase/NADH:ubiquinone oxidoreductase subunit G